MIDLYTGARLAMAAYELKLNEPIKGFRFGRDILSKDGDTQAITGTYDDTLIIAFAGTNSLADWRINLHRYQMVTPYDPKYEARGHAGFFDAWMKVRNKIQNIVAESDHKKVMVIGHSQGGAVGIFAALDIAHNNRHLNVGLIVYGCPKVGNEALMMDVLTYVPGAMAVENGDDGVVKQPGGSEYAPLGFSTIRIGGNDSLLPSEMIKDHLLKNYIELLKEN